MREVSTPWERELLQSHEEIRLIERERALCDIALLMRRYEITVAELQVHMLDGGRAENS